MRRRCTACAVPVDSWVCPRCWSARHVVIVERRDPDHRHGLRFEREPNGCLRAPSWRLT
jgi:hypothetical protein